MVWSRRYRRLAVSREAQPSHFAIAEAATCSVAAARPKRSVATNALIPAGLDKENPRFPRSLSGPTRGLKSFQACRCGSEMTAGKALQVLKPAPIL